MVKNKVTKLIKKLALSVFQPIYWILLVLGVILLFIPKYYGVSHLILNFILLIFFIRVSIVIHEIGHLLFARLVGGTPRRIILGFGHKITSFRISDVKVVINSKLQGGFASSTFRNRKYIRWKQFVNSLGGALMNFSVVLITYVILGFDYEKFTDGVILNISANFILANVLVGITSLIPFYVNYYGMKIPTDGLSLLKLPFQKGKALEAYVNYDELFEANDHIEERNYKKAIPIFEKYTHFENSKVLSEFNLGTMYLKIGEVEKAHDLIRPCLDSVQNEEFKNYRALVYNNLAWIYLLQGRYEDANELSKTSYEINPKEYNFKGTRGCCLVEIGELDEGIDLLTPLVDFNYANNNTLTNAIYLGFGYHQKNNFKKRDKYLKFIDENISILDIDELMIYDSVKERIKGVKSS